MARKSSARQPAARVPAGATPRLRNEVRVIAGRWRGRRVSFATVEGLRPSPDRVRETLFNWLQPCIAGSRCLDLFAGSGVLGIEALSRGASHCVFVDREPAVITQLRENLARLGAADAELIYGDALEYLRSVPQPFDIVFVDPPFASGQRAAACRNLAAGGWLAPGALIYIEQSARVPLDDLPADWQVLKAKRAGEVGYHLLRSSQ